MVGCWDVDFGELKFGVGISGQRCLFMHIYIYNMYNIYIVYMYTCVFIYIYIYCIVDM